MIKIVTSFFVLMVMISAGTVYSLKETTERLEARKMRLSADILKDRAAIKVLKAEMAYLSQPSRLQKLSRRFLALTPSRSYQMADDVTAISGREDIKRVSYPVDEFPMLLPQEKPTVKKKKYNKRLALASYPVKKKRVNKKIKKNSFYDRISLKLGEGE
ncbi:MAG: hypothetical protein KAI89_08485 [Emcibacter sp.]|nr:hypothetical protein [Emcibacter sp.]